MNQNFVSSPFVEDFKRGMLHDPKTIPPKYFYDDVGSRLFEQICDLPEYYPTRVESALLSEISIEIIDFVKPNCITELGSGASRKTNHLFDACEKLNYGKYYEPVDVCAEMLSRSSVRLEKKYDWLSINPIVGDYTKNIKLSAKKNQRKLFIFLGGTIGNFQAPLAVEFLRKLKNQMSHNDYLLIGADRVKRPDLLHAAYNDAAGFTAKFNLNVLSVFNKKLKTQFVVDNFHHYAFYNPIESQVEMHLVSSAEQCVEVDALNEKIFFNQGESILTEISRKFTKKSFEKLLKKSGFEVDKHFESDKLKFSLILAHPSNQ